jgi:GT2 family glycosyltransferase
LNDLGQLRHPDCDWELLVIDNGSTDATPRLLAQKGWCPATLPVRVIREDALGVSNARNRALREASGEYIVFIDDDETPDVDWLRVYRETIETHRPDAFGGRIDVMFEAERPAWLQDDLLGFLGKLDHGEARWLNDQSTPIFTGNCGFRRATFERVGTFDRALGRSGARNSGGEDTELYRRLIAAGCKVRWVPQAVIYHRIQSDKLARGYFLDLHYRQGRAEGARGRGSRSRLPPKYLLPQLFRATRNSLARRVRFGSNHSLRLEMNVAYFYGYMLGWTFDAV